LSSIAEGIAMHSIIIWQKAEQNMIGSWTDEILCTRRKDGTFSLRQRSVVEDGTLSPAGKTRIRSPEVFVQVLFEMSDFIGPEEIAGGICTSIDKLDRKFSKKIRAHIATL
jgi:hypothetical protein